jgi:uncharacterized protein (TIGR01777 family)
MRALITGVTGFVGMRLGALLDAEGWEVHGVARDPARAREKAPFLRGVQLWSGLDPAGFDALVHLAGEPVAGLWTAAKRDRIHSSRVDTTHALVEAMGDGRPAVLVCASAVGYYGVSPDREIAEDDPPGEGFLADVCRGWEREAERAEELGVRVVRMRIGLVMGREGGTLAAMLPAFKAGLGGRLGSGRQWWPWIHVDDVVAMIRAALTSGWSGAYNATAPSPVTQREFAKTLGRVLRRPALVPMPAAALELALGDFGREVLASRRVMPRRALEQGFVFRFPELEPALRDLLSA